MSIPSPHMTTHSDPASSGKINSDKNLRIFVDANRRKDGIKMSGAEHADISKEPVRYKEAESGDSAKDGDERGVKRSSPDSTSEGDQVVNVHSANEWENANLGDDSRKNKFLKLMGASKKEHHGRFVIGEKDTHGNKADTTGTLAVGIEAQFQQSMDHKLKSGYRGHLGLGFSKEEKKAQVIPPEHSEASSKESSEADPKLEPPKLERECTSERPSERRGDDRSEVTGSHSQRPVASGTSEAAAAAAAPAPSKADKYKTMSFVKSSS